jgi:hypothetical protein
MRPTSISVTTTAASAWIPVDIYQSPVNIGIGCQLMSGTATYSVQHTFDDVFDPTVTPFAFDHATIDDSTTSAHGNYAFPIRAVRLKASAISGEVKMTVLQGRR